MGYLLLQKLESMDANQNVSVSIDFQQVPIECIEPEATHRKRWIIFKLHDSLRIAHEAETRFNQIESQCFQGRRFVFCKKRMEIIKRVFERFYLLRIAYPQACNPCRIHRTWCFPNEATDWRKFCKKSEKTKKMRLVFRRDIFKGPQLTRI